MSKKATAADAQLILELYDLRREAEMRKARHWWGATFQPTSADDLAKAIGGPESAWFRQVGGYWDMVASLVLRGALNEELFFDCGAELWFVVGKVYPFLKEFRASMNSPDAFRHAETLATRTKQGRERLQRMIKRHEATRRKTMAETAKAS